MIKSDLTKGTISVFRGGVEKHTWKYKEFITAKQFRPVMELQQKIQKLEKEEISVTQEEEKKLDIDWFNTVCSVGLEEPLNFDSASDILSTVELRSLSMEVFSFLLNWSSTEEAKQFATSIEEIKKKEETPSQNSPKLPSKT